MSPSKVSTIEWDVFYNVINGEKRTSQEQHYGVDPRTSEHWKPVPIATSDDVEEAVKAAKTAFESYRETTVEKRKELLSRFKDLVLGHAPQMTTLLIQETGKTKEGAQQEAYGIEAWFDAHLRLDPSKEKREESDQVITTTRYTPIGPVVAITPWNFPLILSIGKIVPALLTGNTIIVKPSPYTPYSTLKLVELAQEIYSPGIVQVLGGDDKLGPLLTDHPDIRKISFTGSIATGKKVMMSAAKTLKRVTLELGGNDPSIVLRNVDPKKVAPKLVESALVNAGQVCVATKRIYIHEDIYDETLANMVEYAKTLDPKVQPLQNSMQHEKASAFYKDTKDKGYKFAYGSADHPSGKGFYLQPSIIDNPPDDSRIVQEEPFAPIFPVLKYNDLEDVIRRANSTETGLGACVWGSDLAEAEKVARRIESGSVWINSQEAPSPFSFFGGIKESGIGGEWGEEGIRAYQNPQVLHVYKNGL